MGGGWGGSALWISLYTTAHSCDLVVLKCFCIYAVVFVWEMSGGFPNCMYFSEVYLLSVFFKSVFFKVYFPNVNLGMVIVI